MYLLYVYAHICICTHTCLSIQLYMRVCICVCMRIHVCVCADTLLALPPLLQSRPQPGHPLQQAVAGQPQEGHRAHHTNLVE